jgi:hypothetical protein
MNYIEKELYRIAPFPILNCDKNGQFRMKLTSGTDAHNKRQTNWMNLSPEQFAAIEYLVATHPAFNVEAVE